MKKRDIQNETVPTQKKNVSLLLLYALADDALLFVPVTAGKKKGRGDKDERAMNNVLAKPLVFCLLRPSQILETFLTMCFH